MHGFDLLVPQGLGGEFAEHDGLGEGLGRDDDRILLGASIVLGVSTDLSTGRSS
jgi:hypothetical protein